VHNLLRDPTRIIETGTKSKILIVVFIAVSLTITSKPCVLQEKRGVLKIRLEGVSREVLE